MDGVFLGQGWLQVGELLLAFLLSSLVGLERQLRGKAAGIRTQAIVGTSSALFFLVSKYGFARTCCPRTSCSTRRASRRRS